MTHYTFTCRDRDIVLVTPIIGGFKNDAEAIAAARALTQRHEQVEVWQGVKLVQRLREQNAA
jgi:phosphohistidine swiveling domain-containing protein